jgi:outer membrane receptor protein involved in Fe transport
MRTRRYITACTIVLFACSLRAADEPKEKPLDTLLGTPVSTATEYEHVLSSTASKYDQELANTPASITVITSEEIERYGWTTLDQVLQSVPGFYLTNDRNYTYLGVRGIGRPTDYNSRIMVMVDGHVQNEPVFGGAPAGASLAIDFGTVEKIEIIHGPGSALYGSHAMHAVINVITRTADDMDGLGISARAGSRGNENATFRFGRTFDNGLQMTASGLWETTNGANLHFPEYDAPESGNGVAHGRDYEDRYGFRLGLRKGNFALTASRRSRTKGIPTGSYESLFDVDSYTTDWHDLVDASYHRTIGADKILELRAGWDRTGEHGIWPYDPSPGIDDTLSVRLNGEARLHWDIRPNQRLTVGTEYVDVPTARYKYDVGDYKSLFESPYRSISYYAEYNYRPTPRLGLVAGVRRDDFSSTADSINPRAAILFTPSKSTTLKLLYGTAFRSPNTYETLYSDPVTPWKANPELKPERVSTIELVWEQRLSPELFVVGSAYHISASNLIDQELDPSDQIYSYQNAGRIKSHGAELKLDLRRQDGLWGYLSYSLADAHDAMGHLDNSPEHMVKGGISTSPFNPVHFGLDAAYESARFTRDGGRSDAFLLLNGTVSKQLSDHFRLGLSMRNLLDTRYATPVGPELRQQSIRQDGRTFALELTWSR